MGINILAFLLITLFTLTSTINIPQCDTGSLKISFKDTQSQVDNTTSATLCH
jgi:hypothetical protein